jgi:tetratricopeptide (TPR) repeat protein
MRVASYYWLSGVVLATVVCLPAFEGRQASAAPHNPLRPQTTSTPVAVGESAVRFVAAEDDAFGASFPSTDYTTFDRHQSDETLPVETTTLGAGTTAPRRGASPAAVAAFEGDARPAGPTVHRDDQVAPAAHYRTAPREIQPRRASTPPPIYHGLREESMLSPSSPEPTIAEETLAEPRGSQDRLHGSGGIRSAQPASASQPQTQTQTRTRTQQTTTSQRSSAARPSGRAKPEYQSAAPVVNASRERSLKMALAGVSPSSRPTSVGNQSALPAEQLLRQAHDWASVARGEDDFTRIIDSCQKAVRLKPNAVAAEYGQNLAAWAFNRRGQLRSQTGQQRVAMADFNAAIRLDPQCWRALHNRGVLLSIARKFEPAFDDFNRTISINPSYAKAYSNRAALFVVAGQLDLALPDYRTAVQLDPELVTAHRGQARVCHLLGQLDEALEHYDVAVRLTPKDAYTVSRRAELLTDLGRYAEATADYDLAIQLDPQLASAYRGSAWLLATCPDESIHDPDQAVRRAELAVRLEKTPSADSLDALAAAQAGGGDFQAAQKTVQRAIQLAPANVRKEYVQRLAMYRQSQPYRLEPKPSVQQATFAR